MVRTFCLSAVGAMLLALVVATPPAAEAATAGSLTLAPATRIAGESFSASGSLPPSHTRTVRLQRLVGTTWTNLLTKTSSSTGTFSFSTTAASSTSQYRVYAPAATLGGVAWPAVNTPSRTLTVQTQTASITGPATLERGTTGSVVGTFGPVRSGRPVTLQRASGSSWVTEKSGTENSSGVASFGVLKTVSGSYAYRVVAGAWHGAAAKASASKAVSVTDTKAPSPVSGASVTDRQTTQVSLGWTNPTTADLAGVRIRRALGSTAPASASAGTQVADVAKPGVSVTDTGLASSTTYSYALFAYDADGNYSIARTLTVTTKDGTPPGPVTGVTTTDVSPSTASFTWTNPGDADFASVVVRRAAGATAPATATSGTAVGTITKPGAELVDTGLAPNTQYSYAFFARDTTGNVAASATTTLTTNATSSADWLQMRADAQLSATSSGESILNTHNAAQVAQEWEQTPGTPLVSGSQAWVFGRDDFGSGQVKVYNLSTGSVADEFTLSTCGPSNMALTATLVLLQCDTGIRAYARAAGHALVWDTAVTDGDHTFSGFEVSGTSAVVYGPDRVSTYALSDGQRVWQQLLPSGAGGVSDVAISGTSVIVAYDDRVRALSLTNGSQLWTQSVTGPSIVVGGAWVYVADGTNLFQLAVSNGAAGWSVAPPYGTYQVLAVDADTVYLWSALFDFSSPYPSILRALRTSDGSEKWSHDVAGSERIRDIAITRDLVWVVSSAIYTQGRYSALQALSRPNGNEQKLIEFPDNSYESSMAVGDGKVLISQGGSSGEPVPARLRVFGVGGALPTITTEVLGLGRVGSAYSEQLSVASGTPTWSVVGSMPAGLSLSSAGAITGTPTSAGTSNVKFRATASNGRSAEVTLPLGVVATTTPSWTGLGRDGTRNGLEPGTGALDITNAATFNTRWTTAAPSGAGVNSTPNVAAVGDKIYTVDMDGALDQFSATGSTAASTPLWTATADDSATFTDQVLHAGDRVLVADTSHYLYARKASDGTALWKTATTGWAGDAVVVGGAVVGRTFDGHLKAVSLSDGAPLWSGNASPITGLTQTAPSTDGTRVYIVAGCVLYAVNPSTGAEVWHDDMRGKTQTPPNCFAGYRDSSAPIVVGGKVYASEVGSRMIVNATDGTVVDTFSTFDYAFCQSVLVGGLWISWNGDSIIAVDTTRHHIVWTRAWYTDGAGVPMLSASGDLIVVSGTGTILGFDRRTGDTVWDGGPQSTPPTTATVGGDRIFLATYAGVRAFGP